MQKITKIIACLLFGVAIFLLGYATVTGMTHNYMLFSFLLAAGICGLFFVSFESRRPALRDIMPVIIICTLASAGRVIFGFLPQVQPVTAIVIITGICYGQANRIFNRSPLCIGIQYDYGAGTLDTLADASMGNYWLDCWYIRKIFLG